MDHETTASYEQAGFGQSTEFGATPAVLVVDMCSAYFEPESPLFLDRAEVADQVRTLVESARAAAVPVVWTRVEYEPDGPNGAVTNGGVWYKKLGALLCSFDRGNPFGAWLPGLVPAASEIVVTKQHASGFFGTDLKGQLDGLGVDSVLIAGVSTSGCVRATATDASAHSLTPFVVREAVGDRTAAVNDANLFDLHAKYADVITMADARIYLETTSSADKW